MSTSHHGIAVRRAVIPFICCLLTGCIDTDSIVIQEVDLQKIDDGVYEGRFEHFPVLAAVSLTVRNQEITEIRIVEHREGMGEKAEVIIDKVMAEQSLEVDVVSGATLSSKCILKAIENALAPGDGV